MPEFTPEQLKAMDEVRQFPQYAFQRRHIKPGDKVINIGCDIDLGLLRHDFGALNIDVNEWSKSNNCATAADKIHDAREPMMCPPVFDVAVLGDLLEHFNDEDAVKIIRNAAAVLKPSGTLVITCPEDHRTQEEQNEYAEHVPGVPKCHPRPITIEIIGGWLREAEMSMSSVQRFRYDFCYGWGVTAHKIYGVDNQSEG